MNLFFRKVGSGPPLIILHGLYGSSDNWTSVGSKLGDRYTVFMVDLRNHGHSPHFDGNTYEEMKNDLAGFMASREIEKAILLGHSMGGKLAIWFAADYPERVIKLIVADIAPKSYHNGNSDGQYGLHRNILQAMLDVGADEAGSRKKAETILAGRIPDQKIRHFILKNLSRDHKTHRLNWRINVRVLYDHLDEIVGGVNRSWLEDRIPVVAYPVLFIRGSDSPYVLPADETLIREIYPEARIISIPGAGHWLHVEKPDAFIKAVQSYI